MCTSIDAYFLCPYDPVPLTQSRQEHVHRARRTRKGLVCIYVGGVCRHVGGFQPHEPTQVHDTHDAKMRHLAAPDATPHSTHTHITTRQSHTTTLQQCCAADGENVSCNITVPLATQTTSRAPDENMSEALPSNFPPMQWRLHHLCCCLLRYISVMELFASWLFRKEPTLAHTWLHARFAEQSHSCAAREYRTGRASFLFHSRIGLSPSAARVKRCAITPRHGMT